MKVRYTVIFTVAFLATLNALPRQGILDPSEDSSRDDVEVVPLNGLFNSSFGNFEGVMNRMRQQMHQLLKRFHFRTTDDGDFSPLPQFPRFDETDLGKGNTTSVTKLVDGNIIVINETEYKKEDDLGGVVFRVRIIDVKPNNTEMTTIEDVNELDTDRESVENSFENEIPKRKEDVESNNIETFEVDNVPALDSNNIETFDEMENEPDQNIVWNKTPAWKDVEPFESFEDNSITNDVDLSKDTYVNDIMADAGAPTNPDAEVFYVAPNNKHKPMFEKIINPR